MTDHSDHGQTKTGQTQLEGYFSGRVLVAMPHMNDPNFERAVVFICSHSPEGAMGLIINQPMPEITFGELIEQLDINSETPDILSMQQDPEICFGGPVDTGRGFVLHSDDYSSPQNTQTLASGISLTATLDILQSIANGKGPRKKLLTLGYAGWSAGQMEKELQDNAWLVAEPSEALLFDVEHEEKYIHALASLGITLEQLTSQSGHA